MPILGFKGEKLLGMVFTIYYFHVRQSNIEDRKSLITKRVNGSAQGAKAEGGSCRLRDFAVNWSFEPTLIR